MADIQLTATLLALAQYKARLKDAPDCSVDEFCKWHTQRYFRSSLEIMQFLGEPKNERDAQTFARLKAIMASREAELKELVELGQAMYADGYRLLRSDYLHEDEPFVIQESMLDWMHADAGELNGRPVHIYYYVVRVTP